MAVDSRRPFFAWIHAKMPGFGRAVHVRLCATALLSALPAGFASRLSAQDLAPRAYIITPVNANAITLTFSFYDGSLFFNGALPLTGTSGRYVVPIFSYYHSLKFLGRSANITASLPYAVGNFSGNVMETEHSIYRSGLLDFSCRFSVNLIGGPALRGEEFAKWKQKTLLGASVKVIAPTGQYDPRRLVNWGINRWAFKPELGYSQRRGHWLIDGYAGVWFYTSNPAYFNIPVPRAQTESPIGSFEGHLSYDFDKQRAWASLDGNFWFGGSTTLNGIKNPDTRQTSSRLGATASFPLGKHQSVKVAYSVGTYVRFGGNYKNVQAAWQYSWIGKAK